MRAGGIVPTGVERTFGVDEVIVSKTDPKGVITYANDVFLRVSGYAEAEILGKPHNIIRHPDMPRCVFSLLWETIAAGDEIFAYVLNLARDGAHYWVHAHVTPTFGPDGGITGYHSNRRLPQGRAVEEVGALYRTLLAEERRHTRPKEALAAGRDLLDRVLEQRGQSYGELVWSITNESLAGAR